MKRLLSTMMMLGALAGTASAAPYVLPSPQPGDLTPYDWQPVYSIEGIYSMAEDDAPDTCGIRGSFSLYNNAEGTFRHQFSLNVAPAWGSEDYVGNASAGIEDIEAELFIMPVTLGYNLHVELLDNTFFYIGGKAGYAWCSYEETCIHGTADDTTGGFTFSVGAGFKVQCNDHLYVHAGYEYGRTYLDRDYSNDTYDAHTISVGIGCTF